MNDASSGKASDTIEKTTAGQPFGRFLSDRHIRIVAAILMLAGGFSVTSSAIAQTQDTASCIANCKAEEPRCKNNGSSEELCEYDSKQCQKACAQGQ